ncbi:MAG: Ig-like domain-containing protein [Bacteroidetes bacterium]|nr:Ig-like domain-containing protein [Bacteroidota bacterium]
MRKRIVNRNTHFILLLSISLLFYGCAQVVSPTGGEKDETPPKIVKSNPANGSILFKDEKIQLNFSEYIKVKDANNQLIISPPLKKTPELKVKNKTLTLDIEDSLKANTTYTFSFGNSIVDFTEENPLENFQFVFSTGNYLDSMSVLGKVENAMNHIPEKGVLVMLYALEKTSSDSFPYHEIPDYFGKSNEFGNYTINNIREGKYKMLALKDGNTNYLFDSEDEQIAFLDSVITINKKLQIDVSLFQELKSKLYLKKPVKNYDGQVICAFSRPVEKLSFENLTAFQKFDWKATEISSNKDTARFWFAGASSDSIQLKVLSAGKVFDTVQVAVVKTKGEVAGRERRKLNISTNINPNGTFDLTKKIQLVLPQLVNKVNRARISIIHQKDTLPFVFNAVDSLKRKFEIGAAFAEDSAYTLLIPSGTFEGYDGLQNDTLKIQFRMLTQRDYGTLKFAVKLKENSGNFILQMLDEAEHVVNERFLTKSEILIYEYIKPQNYKFKLIFDSNSNQKWNTGNFLQHLQPEKVMYYPQILTIRANWDLEEKWDLTK